MSDFPDELIPQADSPGEPDTRHARREFLLLLQSAGFSEPELRIMSARNPAGLFEVGSGG